MRASPESLSRILRKAGSATRRSRALGADLEAGEPAHDHVLPRLGRERGPDLLEGLAPVLVLVDVDLLEQDVVLHPLAQAPFRHLLADLLGLALRLGLR